MKILLSIKPNYVDAIFAGEKLYEFRRRPFRIMPSTVVVYATAPIGKIVGWFTVKDMLVASPSDLWTKCGESGHISKSAFDAYYSGTDAGIALEIDQVFRLPEPIRVEQLTGQPRPPQAFQYVDDVSFERNVMLIH